MDRQPDNLAAHKAFEDAVTAALQRVELIEETPENARVWARMVNAFIEFARRQPVRRPDPASYRRIKFERADAAPAGDSISRVYRVTVPLGRGAGVLEAYVSAPPQQLDIADLGAISADGNGCPVCIKRLYDARLNANRKKRRVAQRARGWAPIDLDGPLFCAVGFHSGEARE